MALLDNISLCARFPEFGEQQPAVINATIVHAERQTPASVWGNSGFRVDGVAYLSAHLLAIRIMQIGAQIGAPSGQVLGGGLDSTHYGQEYKRLRDSIAVIGFAAIEYSDDIVDYEPSLPPTPITLPNEHRTYNTPTTSYYGTAPANTSESSPVWTIVRRTFSNAGVLETTSTAFGAWADLTLLPYT